ncbi:MAG: hypothetical protein HRT88_02115 [Lentisphaeraceae bacterium]|nr:hypothetical protein [Lentisphaeraceae bacterium]
MVQIASCQRRFGKEQSEALQSQVHQAYQTDIHDHLLTALSLACRDSFEINTIDLDFEGHGRERSVVDMDISRTVACFSSVYPLSLKVAGKSSFEQRDLGQSLSSTKEQLRAIPHQGSGYAYLCYLSDDPRALQLKGQQQAQVYFNYRGDFDSSTSDGLALSEDNPGAEVALEKRLKYLLEVNAFMSEGCLTVDFNYSREHFSNELIEVLAENYVFYLQKLIEHCCLQKEAAFTASDFAFDTSQQVLDILTSQESESETDEIEEF